eukprot:TRINITY_DN29810_c0_g2_i1.p2 TRINITY_DN29810_c0_g2~~TRINITY_DN29810_c0_g2_i1.p2  ORF type:complete len:163 (+),score=43.06 TRINITY_DN29810_c0_g2_i1:3-491(+)
MSNRTMYVVEDRWRIVLCILFFFFSSRRRHTRCREVSWARRCVQETVSTQSTWVSTIETTQSGFFYENNTLTQRVYEVSTSHPECLTLLQPTFVLAPGENTQILFLVSPHSDLSSTPVLLFLYDTTAKRTDTILLTFLYQVCLLYTSPSPRDLSTSRMPSSA